MSKRYGFTLVELLVVVAIIAILASIVVPNVTRYIARGQMAKAVSEINSIELAMTAMLADAERRDFRDFFTPNFINTVLVPTNLQQSLEIYDIYTDIMYALLRTGRNARQELGSGIFNDAVLDRLSTNYLDIDVDPWNNKYYFYLGRARAGTSVPMRFRSYILQQDLNGDGVISENELVVWDRDTRTAMSNLPGAPPEDPGNPLPGRPAPDSQPFFIWSMGANLRHDQEFAGMPHPEGLFRGGGDDINNWDPQRGWQVHYGG